MMERKCGGSENKELFMVIISVFFLMCYFYVDYAKETKFALRRRLRIKNSNYT